MIKTKKKILSQNTLLSSSGYLVGAFICAIACILLLIFNAQIVFVVICLYFTVNMILISTFHQISKSDNMLEIDSLFFSKKYYRGIDILTVRTNFIHWYIFFFPTVQMLFKDGNMATFIYRHNFSMDLDKKDVILNKIIAEIEL